MKRVVVIADLHGGHRAGLTPPKWQYKKPYKDDEQRKYAEVQAILWDFAVYWAKKLQPIHALFVNGDAIEGKGYKNGGLELLTPDRKEQAEIAAEGIKLFKPQHIRLTYGSPYHVGNWEDWEDLVAQKVGAPKPRGLLEVTVGGIPFNLRHFAPRSVIWYGRATPILRQELQEKLWAEWEERPAARILIRHHVHYHVYAGDPTCVAMTGPSLQAYSEFGTRLCEGIVHMGLLWFDIDERERTFRWESKIIKGKVFKSALSAL